MNKNRAALAALALLSHFSIAKAETLATAELGLFSFSQTDSQTCTGCVAQVTHSFGPPNFPVSMSGDVTASASFGVLRASARSGAFGNPSPLTTAITHGGRAQAQFQDFFQINNNNPLLQGTLGTVTIPLSFVWGFVGSSGGSSGVGIRGNADIRMQWDPNMGNSNIQISEFREDFDRNSSFKGAGSKIGLSTPFSVIPFTFTPTLSVTFKYGLTISLIYDLKISETVGEAGATGFLNNFATLDAGHSAYWGGFESVLDANGQPAAYTTTSFSGHDWSKSSIPSAVPTPVSSILMLSGLGAILFFARPKQTPNRSLNMQAPC